MSTGTRRRRRGSLAGCQRGHHGHVSEVGAGEMCPAAGVASFRLFSPPCPLALDPARGGPGMHPRS
eukprot:14352498-Heterocapsa_arctica.AAC.1